MTRNEVYEAIKPLMYKVAKKGRRVYGPYAERRDYRGRPQCVVGYCWTTPYSHHMSGNVYDAVVASANTYEEAIKIMARKAALVEAA